MKDIIERMMAIEKQARQIVEDAEKKAEKILEDARKEARKISEEVRAKAVGETQRLIEGGQSRALAEKEQRLKETSIESQQLKDIPSQTLDRAVTLAVESLAGGSIQSSSTST